jgi:hypothetical protein
VALGWLDHLAWAAPDPAVRARSRALLARRAAAAGVEAETLAEQVLPTHGFDARGCQPLGDAPPGWTARLDHRGEVLLHDPSGLAVGGRKKAGIPAAARAGADALARAVRVRVAQVRARLEEAMIAGRTWTPQAFAALFLDHPLLYPFTRQLVFAVGPGCAPGRPFLISEEGEPLGRELEAARLDGPIRVVHPAELPEADAWRALWAELARDQPFRQLGRTCFDGPVPGPVLRHAATAPAPRRRLVAAGWASAGPGLLRRTWGDWTLEIGAEEAPLRASQEGEPGELPPRLRSELRLAVEAAC